MKLIATILVLWSFTVDVTKAQEFGLFKVELNYGAGFTAIDMEEWAGSTLNDWNQFTQGGHLQLYFMRSGNFMLGFHFGYPTLFWYETRDDNLFSTPYFRQYYPSAAQIMAVGQIGGDEKWFGEFAIGGYAGDAISGLGLGFGGGYLIPLKGGFSLPIKLRADAIFAEQTMVATTLFIGVAYTFD